MNWITNFVRPKLKDLIGKKDTPENLWVTCSSCGQMLHHKEIKAAQRVCRHCNFHMRQSPQERFEFLFDDGEFTLIELPKAPPDPLKFRDQKRYPDRLKDARNKTGQDEAVIVAHGSLGGAPLVAAAQNFAFMGGSMGIATGEALIAAARLAVLQQAPLVAFSAAGGARMQEGILSLMQMPRTTIAVEMVKEQGLPFISVLTDPTTGGVTASYAMLGDVNMAEPGAMIGFAGPRVIESTVREQLPEGFQRAEYLLEHGMLDMVVHRHEMRDTLIRVLGILTGTAPPADVLALPPRDLDIPDSPGAGDGEATADAETPAGDEARQA